MKVNTRAFLSLFLLLTMIMVSVSGIILAIAPSGNVASVIDFKVFGLDKTAWENIHTIFGYAMIIAICFHLKYNWRVLVGSFRKYVGKIKKIRLLEFIIAVALFLFIFIGTMYNIPPMSSVLNLGENLKTSWESKVESEGVVVVKGYMTVEEACKAWNVDLNYALKKLKEVYPDVSPTTTLRTIMTETKLHISDIETLVKGE